MTITRITVATISIACSAAFAQTAPAQEASLVISEARDIGGVIVHDVQSPYQTGTTEIQILLPEKLDPEKKYPVVYLLPVEAQHEHKYGDGMKEALRIDLANRHQVICVAPTFSQLPWYADHPTDKHIRQETYLLRVVVPFVDRHSSALANRDGRLLVGFSKSGWGAVSLLLRHPEVFGKAAAWDAPLMMEEAGRYGSGPIFGTQENFDSYRLDWLIKKQGNPLGSRNRLVLTSYDAFREQHQRFHQLLVEAGILHTYRDGPFRKHNWHSGWVEEAVELLLTDEAEVKKP